LLAVQQNAYARCDKSGEGDFAVPAASITPNGTAVGRPVSPWLAGSVVNIGGCTDTGTMNLYVRASAVGTYIEDGKFTYGVFSTGVPGLGLVAGIRSTHESGLEFRPLRVGNNGTIDFRNSWPYPEMRVRYIKTGDIPPGDYVSQGVVLGDIRVNDWSTIWFSSRMSSQGAPVAVANRPMCFPQATHVNMGSVPMARFSGQLSGSEPKAFNVSVHCEADVGDILFYLEPTGDSAVIDAAKGIVAVSGGAGGVGIQMLHGEDANQPIPFEKTFPFGSTLVEGRLSKAFKARYVQTAKDAKDVHAGPANATIRLVLDYP